ncbi:hypothetical protein [Sphingomonas sp. CROZ-RG-20F-R02-07]|uniref:hypothetical protein n=1 Tax=Sphingomonas sp. CROZ-RG-20F-R02-07 TaxID=2914832 RepID=UPI001F5854DC|nr:hypothetical protein [Sphingomonas sp. CROZ-RG-20F-R02-07]
MLPYATQPLGGWRNEPCLIPIAVPGVDLAGKAMRAQIRGQADNPVLMLDLPAVTDPAATGIRVLPTTFDAAGVPTGQAVWQITKAGMQSLPYAGEIGDAWVGAYALQLDGQTRLAGPFGAIASPIDSDNAPANRPVGWGGAAGGALVSGVTLTIGTGGVTVQVDGAGLLAALLLKAKTQADIASAAALASGASAAGAAGSAASATRDAATAATAANVAGQYRQGIADAVAGLPTAAVLPLQASDRPTMAGFTGQAQGRQAFLSEAGREGYWLRDATIAAGVFASDPRQGLYVATTAAGEVGGWRRIVRAVAGVKPFYPATWWGLGPGYGINADLLIENALTLMPAHTILVLPAATDITWGDGTLGGNLGIVHIDKDGQEVVGAGRGETVCIKAIVEGNAAAMFQLRRSYTAVRDLSGIGGRTHLGANNVATIYVSQTGVANPVAIVGAKIERCHSDGSIGYLAIPATANVNGQDTIVGDVTVTIDDCTYNGHYQGISCFQSLNVRINRFKANFDSETDPGELFCAGIRNNGGIGTVANDIELTGNGLMRNALMFNGSMIGNHRQLNTNDFYTNVRVKDVFLNVLYVNDTVGIVAINNLHVDNSAKPGAAFLYMEATGGSYGVYETVDRFEVRNFTGVGLAAGFTGTGTASQVVLENGQLKGRLRAADGTADVLISLKLYSGDSFKDLRVKNVDFDWPAAQINSDVSLQGTNAGERYVITGCRFPARAGGPKFDFAGAGSAVTSFSKGPVAMTDNTDAGDNGCFPSS